MLAGLLAAGLLGYHTFQGTFETFDGPEWTFGYEIGHVAKSLYLGHGFSYRIRGAHGTVPSVTLNPSLRGKFHRVPIAAAVEGEASLRGEAVPVTWASPAYTVLLASLFGLFGLMSREAAVAAVISNCIFQGLALFVFASLARRVAGPVLGLLATFLFFFEPSGIVYSGHIWSQSLYTLGAVSLVHLTLFAPQRLPDVLFGVVAAGVILADSSAAPLVLVCFVARAWRSERSGLRPQLVAALVAALCLAPWAIRNGRTIGVYTPLKATTGIVAHMGNSPQAARVDYYNGLHANPFWNGEEMLLYARHGERLYDRHCWGRFLAWVVEDPGRFATASLDRVTVFWLGRYGLEWTRGDLASHGLKPLDPSRTGERWNRLWRAGLLCLLPLGLVQGIRSSRTRNAMLLFGGIFLFFPLVYYVTIAIDRYRSPLDPFLCLTAALAFAPLVARFAREASGEDP